MTDEAALSSEMHNGLLLSLKATNVIRTHEANGAAGNASWQPLFLYYATPLVHASGGYTAPAEYIQRCASSNHGLSEQLIYCGLLTLLGQVML